MFDYEQDYLVMNFISQLVGNKKNSKFVFYGLVVLIIATSNVPDNLYFVKYIVLGITVLWAIVYHFTPKQETVDEMRWRKVESLIVLVLVVIAFFFFK